jgi:hypothetical protein
VADDGMPYPGVSQLETASDWEAFFTAVQLDGVVSGLTPTINSGARTASLGAGSAYLRGYLKPVSSTTAKPVPAASGQDRVDRLVLRLDRDAATAATYIVPTVLTGLAGTVTPPALTRSPTGDWDLPISRWTSKSDGTLTGLVDERYGPSWFTSAARAGNLVSASPARIAHEVDTGSIYRSDGTTWTLVSQDSGWVELGLNGADKANWTVDDALKYRLLNGVVYLRFSITSKKLLPLTDSNGSMPYQLPAGFRPGFSTPPVLGHGNHARNGLQLYIYAGGEVRVYPMDADLPAGRRIYAQAQFPVG